MRLGRRAPAARMFVVYAVLSAIPVCALGALLDLTYRHGVAAQGLAQGRA